MSESNYKCVRMPLVVAITVAITACSGAPIRGAHADQMDKTSDATVIREGKSESAMQAEAAKQQSMANRQQVTQTQTRVSTSQQTNASTSNSNAEIDPRNQEISRLRRELDYANLRNSSGGVIIVGAEPALSPLVEDDELLPPNARPGECYARVFIPPQYEEYEEQVLVREASEEVEVIPAVYQEVEEEITVSAATVRYETRPAVYETVTESLLVRESERSWRVSLDKNSAPANTQLLNAATGHGINLNAATAGMCFHEHYEPAQYDMVDEVIVVKEAGEKIEIAEPVYKWDEKEIVVKEASYEMKTIPAKYETVTEKVIDKPAHTEWKRGTGPIQKIDESTGEIMCLVEVPATYKNVSKRVLVAPARTERIEVPEVRKKIKVKVLASSGVVDVQPIPEKTKVVKKRVKKSDERFVWHEIHNKDHPASTRTGNQICLVETPAKYENVSRQVLKTPAQRVSIDVPAQTEVVRVNKVVAEAREVRKPISAEYGEVSHQRLVREGYMEWRSILCDTNMTRTRISDIQKALRAQGYNPGNVDGVIGQQTMHAVNAFQRSNGLPVDEYLNIATVQALGVSPN